MVEITDHRTVSVPPTYKGCVLEMLQERFLIDLVSLPLREIMVIVGIDWLNRFGVVIECKRQLMRVQTLSRG